MRENGEAIAGEDTKPLALLLAVIHVAEERIRLGSEIVIDPGYVLILGEGIRVLEVDLLFVVVAVRIDWVVKSSPVAGRKVLDHRSILAVELRSRNDVPHVGCTRLHLANRVIGDSSGYEYLPILYQVAVGVVNRDAGCAAVEIAHVARTVDR